MPTVRRTRQAEEDLTDIALFIAKDSGEAAFRLLDRLEARFEMLSKQPEIGELRPDLARGLRSFAVGNYVIFYESDDDGIIIVRVLHAARDVDALF